MQLPEGAYNFTDTEKRILEYWLSNGFYRPEYHPATQKLQSTEEMLKDPREPFCIICPPPNAYGRPHLGNISGYAYQDAIGRYARMTGRKVLLLPGKDHAGLEGEGVFIREVLEKERIDKFSLDREDFYQRMWDFNQENMKLAQQDEKTIGLSADFERDIFTLDPAIVKTVLSTFVEMFEQGMIYQGVRIVNWDPKARSTVADNQCERKEREGKLYFVKYQLASGGGHLTVATSRPETMFGDTAIAVNPEDERYKGLIGKEVIVPLTERRVPIISDYRVDKEFGTGALKITPAHALDDFLIMQSWNESNPDKAISYLNVVGKDLKLCGPVPQKYLGQKYKHALPEIVEDLKSAGLLEKEESLVQNILVSERTGAVIEPIMSSQWFVRVDSLVKPVIQMVKDKKVVLYPENMEAKFFYWMENLKDWAISRSLWWGYRIPVWYAGEISEVIDENGQVEVAIKLDGVSVPLDMTNPAHVRVQIDSPGEGWLQDDNVLDTWFSSGQWPFATLQHYGLMDEFYPTDVMETGYDILENWVSRMMMFSQFKFQKEPFRHVYLHGLVKGTDGQKMSKSRKNIIPLDEAQDAYGIDALRMVYFYQNSAGSSYALTHDKLKNFRNFNNKLWNASKYTLANIEGIESQLWFEELSAVKSYSQFMEFVEKHSIAINDVDSAALKQLGEQEEDLHLSFERFKFGNVTENLYQNFWHFWCDEYIESSKARFAEGNRDLSAQITLYYGLKSFLKMLHPFIPHITEEVWQYLPKGSSESPTLMYAQWF